MKKILSLILVIGIIASQSLMVCASSDKYLKESELNNTFDQADTFKIYGNYTYYIYGSINHDDVSDVYKLVTSRPGKITIQFTYTNAEYDLLLYDSSQDCIDSAAGTQREFFSATLDRNDYVYFSVDSIYSEYYNEPYLIKVTWSENK